jgi:hypothetical protein
VILVIAGKGLTVMLAVSLAVLKGLETPLVVKSVVTLAVPPLVPVILSQALKVMPLVTVPV